MSATTHVIVVGAGLSGACLAHGLRAKGFEVSLYERDPGIGGRGQGYRLHIAPEGDLALRACLPARDYELVLATTGKPGSGVTILDRELNTLQKFEVSALDEPETGRHLTVDRETFRRILLAGLQDVTRFGAEFSHYEQAETGRVRACFADGHTATADLLVAADGATSPVRAQLLPQASVEETGQTLIYGKTPLTDEVRALAPAAVLDGFSTVVGPDGVFLPLAGFEFREDPNEAAARPHPGLSFPHNGDYLMWVAGFPTAALGEPSGSLFGRDGTELRKLACGFAAEVHPDLVELVRRGDPADVNTTLVRTSNPIEHWTSGPVTLLGDAIHPMVPAGTSAAVALRDAGLLARRLGEAAPGELIDAVSAYEVEMLDYGFAAVAASRNNLG
jgi:2-polyprenyl-6-methoxyphenol hydroxylase-like FAD-dependent oxidoreductase